MDVIASDHAPKAKKIDDDFFDAPFGSPSAETLLTVTYQKGVNEGRVDLCTLIRALSETPAKIFGLYPQKGILQTGSDADLVIFDPAGRHTISQDTQHSNAGYSLYEGLECLGAPTLVMQRGNIIVEDMKLKDSSGKAKFLPTKILKK
jgi:dihydropyrimidinase